MTQRVRRSVVWLGLLAVLASATPAVAQISLPRTTAMIWAGWHTVAYDTKNEVYLVVHEGQPVTGEFLDINGLPVGSRFLITLEAPDGEASAYTGWSTVAFGGSASDPVFLVTYMISNGSNNPKYGRLVRYRPGAAPLVSDRSKIADIAGEWFSAEKAQIVWNGEKFVVSTRLLPPGWAVPGPRLDLFDTSGNVSGGEWLGDALDYEGSPSLACAPNGTCLASGYALGAPFGSMGGSYARLFDGKTLLTLGGVFYVDNHTTQMENQCVVFNSNTGQFLVTWWRKPGYIDSRLVNTDGTLGPLDLTKSVGPGAGDNFAGYNAGTKTTLLVTKIGAAADLYALELGSDGWPIRPNNLVRLTAWDGRVLVYKPWVAADNVNGRWIATYTLGFDGRAALVQGTLDTTPPPPPPPLLDPPTIATVSPTTGPNVGGTLITITGTNFAAGGTTVTVGGNPGTAVNVDGSTSLTAVTPPGAAGVADVQVTTSGGSYTKTGAFTYLPGAVTDISLVRTTTQIWAGWHTVAYDTKNEVYLVVHEGQPVTGEFLNKNGLPVGSRFLITLEAPDGEASAYTGWSTVAFGGSASDPVFLVTYMISNGSNNPKYGRLVRYRPGAAPLVSDRSKIADIAGEWFSSEKAQIVWNGEKFVVSTRLLPSGWAVPGPRVDLFDTSGNVSGGQLLGDALDYEGSPSLACAPSGTTCMASGYAWGAAFGGRGGSYARLFNGRTLLPLSNVFYVDDHSTQMENQSVVFNTYTGQFLATWWRKPGYIDSRIVNTNGTLGPLDLTKSFGPGAGDNTAGYNAGTRSTLLVTKYGAAADLYALELGANGWPSRLDNLVRLTAWDGRVLVYKPWVAADSVNGRWIATYTLGLDGRAALVQGTVISLAAPTISTVTPSNGPIVGGTTVTIVGTHFIVGDTAVRFGGNLATSINVTSTTSLTAVTPAGAAGLADVEVTTSIGSVTTAGGFMYLSGNPPPTFTDDPLTTHGAPVKAVHLTELRDAINTLRNLNGLSDYPWTDATLVAGVTPVKSVHLTELRMALNQVYVGQARESPPYTDVAVVGGVTVIRAVHIAELRAAVLAIW